MNKKEMIKAKKINKIVIAAIISLLGLIVLKYIPMKLFGQDILFDASAHITVSIFILYVGWFFIEKNKSWRLPYYIFSASILTIVGLQRILAFKHNEYGIMLGFFIGILSISISNWKEIHNKISL